ncbi:MAG: ATP-binding cassette domain-containing protein, partial [Eubacterium sp.]|nr:ATP-binding cassette domain-containing protein [Eubacterium sp.]
MVEAINLTKKYGRNVALCDVSFTLERGKIYGLLGVNGAGKSTTLQLLSGFFAPSQGEVRIGGISMEKAPAA